MKNLIILFCFLPFITFAQLTGDPDRRTEEFNQEIYPWEEEIRTNDVMLANWPDDSEEPSFTYLSISPDGIVIRNTEDDGTERFWYAIVRFYDRTNEVFGIKFTPSNELILVNKNRVVTEANGNHFFSVGDTLSNIAYFHVSEQASEVHNYQLRKFVIFKIEHLYFLGAIVNSQSPFHWRVVFTSVDRENQQANSYIQINKNTKNIDDSDIQGFQGKKVKAMSVTEMLPLNTLPVYWE